MIEKRIKKYSVPLISMLLTFLFFMVYMIINNIDPFGKGTFVVGDCKGLIYPYLCQLRNKLLTGDSLLYYWGAELGDGFLPTYFFSLASPINLLLVFVPENNVCTFINFSIVLRVVFSAGSMGFYLLKRKEDRKDTICIIALSIAYALSGYILGYYNQIMWLDSYAIFPLIMYGYRKLMDDQSPYIYVLCLVYSCLCNFYLTYVIGLFLVLAFLVDRHKSIKEFFRKLIRFGLYSILAIGMSAFSLAITVFALSKTRVGESNDLSHSWFGNIFNILKYQFFLSKPLVVSYDNNTANIYCGTFCLLFFLIYCLSSKIDLSEKVRKLVLLFILFVSMNESILNYIWHGFHFQNGVPNRFSFIYIFVLLLIADDVLYIADDSKRSIIAVFMAEIIPMVIYFFVEFDGLISGNKMLVIILGLLFIYSIIYLLFASTHKKIFINIFAFLMISEIFVQSYISFLDNRYDVAAYQIGESQIGECREENTDAFYRSKVVGTHITNNELLMDLKGVSVFNGYINRRTCKFLDEFGYFAGDVEILDESGFCPLDDILGVKKYYRVNDVYNLDEDYFSYMNYDIESVEDEFTIYNNRNACTLGFGIDNTGNNIEIANYDSFNNVNRMIDNMTGETEVLKEVFPACSCDVEGFDVQALDSPYLYLECKPIDGYKDPYIMISFTAEETGLYNSFFLYLNPGYCNVSVDGKSRRHESHLVSSGVLSIGKVEKGQKVDIIFGGTHAKLTGEVDNPDQLLFMRMAVLDENKYEKFLEKVKKNPMNVKMQSDSRFEGTVELDADQILFTSIPYDEGWHVYENGKEIKKEMYADTFISLDLGAGKHVLEFRYIPEGFYLGLIITIISWIIFVGIIIRNKLISGKKVEKCDLSEETSI